MHTDCSNLSFSELIEMLDGAYKYVAEELTPNEKDVTTLSTTPHRAEQGALRP